MMSAEENYRLLQEIDANRRFLLQAQSDNPALRALAEVREREKWGDWREHAPTFQTEDAFAGSPTMHRPASADFSSR